MMHSCVRVERGQLACCMSSTPGCACLMSPHSSLILCGWQREQGNNVQRALATIEPTVRTRSIRNLNSTSGVRSSRGRKQITGNGKRACIHKKPEKTAPHYGMMHTYVVRGERYENVVRDADVCPRQARGYGEVRSRGTQWV